MAATRLDQKLAAINADPSGSKEFIICDAKDGDMGGGATYPGPRRDPQTGVVSGLKSRGEFLDQIRALVRQDVVDLMLMSVATMDQLKIQEGLFEGSAVATAIRANDTSDIWPLRGASYTSYLSRPFRTALIEHAMYGKLGAGIDEPVVGSDLGLYSMTFNNDLEADLRSLEAFREFRIEAEKKRFRYFLEVFNPNAPKDLAPEKVPAFVNDSILRCIAAVPRASRPLFLKIPYNGPGALEELVAHDPSVVVGILGGGAGTSHDCLKLVHDVKRHGARLVLFGRKINLSEHPLAMVSFMRKVADGELGPAEGVRAYHGELQKEGIRPLRPLDDDLEVTEKVLKAA